MTTVLIGIDDTDNNDSPGTGQLARRVSAEIQRVGGRPLGTTRHQFLVDPRIPYTGHNRGICAAVNWDGPVENLDFVFGLVEEWSAEGSDPGVCIAIAETVRPAIMQWGQRALCEVLTMEEAIALAGSYSMKLHALGGTGQGIIGALGSVGLRALGENGRFVDMPGLRELPAVVTFEKLESMGIRLNCMEAAPTADDANSDAGAHRRVCKTLGWIRPRLSGGKPVLSLEWSDHEFAWVPVERKKVHPLEQG